MQSLADFFARKAKAFVDGNISFCVDTITLPTTIYFCDKVLFADTRASLAEFLATFISNLRSFGVTKVEPVLKRVEPLTGGSARADVLWSWSNERDEVVKESVVSYYCTPRDDSWIISLINVRNNAGPAFKGTPVM